MTDNIQARNMQGNEGEAGNAQFFLQCADAAREAGESNLGIHLYLTAYEQLAAASPVADEAAVAALKNAWSLACGMRERSLAEHIFEKLEPYLTSDEVNACMDKLQEFALMRLEELGIAQDILDDVSEMVSGGSGEPGSAKVMHVQHIPMPLAGPPLKIQEERRAEPLAQDLAPEAGYEPSFEPAPAGERSPEPAAEPLPEPVAAAPEAAAEPPAMAEPAAPEAAAEPQPAPEPEFVPPVLWPFMSMPDSAPTAPASDPALASQPEEEEDPEDAEARAAIAAAIAAAESDSALPGVGFYNPEPVDPNLPPNQTFAIDDMLTAMSNMMASMSDQAEGEGDGAVEEERLLTLPGKPVLPPTSTNAATATLPAPAAPVPASAPKAKPMPQKRKKEPEKDPTLKDLRGYSRAIALVESLGLGLGDDPEFDQLVELLNARHGLDKMPSMDALLLRAPVREDAIRFVEALLGEINLPSLRMRMEDGVGGSQTLCIMTRAGRRPRMNNTHTAFEAPAVLVVEDVDLWAVPAPEQPAEGIEAIVASQMSRGARDAVALIRSAVDDPDVYVLITASSAGEIDPYFCDLLTPFTVLDIENPTDDERADLWDVILEDHPSLRGIPLGQLVKLSAGLSREDILLATREAIEEAYKESLALRTYLPVTAESLFAKLSAFYALDSQEYKTLEDLVVADLRSSLDRSVDDFLGLL